MAEGVLVANRGTTSGCAAMHPTAAFAAHRWRSARMPASGPSSATKGSVHQWTWVVYLNRFLNFVRWTWVHRPNDGLPTSINIHVLDCDLLLTLAAIALQGLKLRRKCPQ